jgi:predicted RNA-binding Zn ribbon-like protein
MIPDASSRSPDRDGFRFRGGHVALDLTATLAGRAKATPRELLASPSDVPRWLASAGLPAKEASEADLEVAHYLREAIYALAVARIAGTDQPAAREILNRIAAPTPALPQLGPKGSIELSGSAAAMLSTIAREAIALFGSSQASHIRQCEADGCTLLFVDNSRRGDRRWCSMAGCGNRAKLAEFRRRKREEKTAAG